DAVALAHAAPLAGWDGGTAALARPWLLLLRLVVPAAVGEEAVELGGEPLLLAVARAEAPDQREDAAGAGAAGSDGDAGLQHGRPPLGRASLEPGRSHRGGRPGSRGTLAPPGPRAYRVRSSGRGESATRTAWPFATSA